jgi:hypothetical protein
MKKSNKLTLNQETLRNLTAAELKTVMGGVQTLNCSGQPQTCQFTNCLGTCPPPAVPVD